MTPDTIEDVLRWWRDFRDFELVSYSGTCVVPGTHDLRLVVRKCRHTYRCECGEIWMNCDCPRVDVADAQRAATRAMEAGE